MRSLKDDESAVAFNWLIILLTAFIVMLVWVGTYDGVKLMMEYSHEVNPDDEIRDYFELIYDYFPLWLLIGLSMYGYASAQRQEY